MSSQPLHGAFVHSSPLSSLPHDPFHSLTSNIVRDSFGPTVQCVADCLLSRCCRGSVNNVTSSTGGGGTASFDASGLTLAEIEAGIIFMCRRTLNEDRAKLVKDASDSVNTTSRGGYRIHMAKGPEQSGYVVEKPSIRAALIVLIQHSLVVVCKDKEDEDDANYGANANSVKKNKKYRYRIDPDRTRYVPRYCRYVEHAREAIDENAATVVELILVNGRMRAEDVLRQSTENIHRFLTEGRDGDNEDEDEESELEPAKDPLIDEAEKAEIRQGILRSFKNLVEGGYVEQVAPIQLASSQDDKSALSMKRKLSQVDNHNHTDVENNTPINTKHDTDDTLSQDFPPAPGIDPDDTPTLTLLRKPPFSRIFPPGSAWRVNVHMFHDILRALRLGNLVRERFEDVVPHAGAIITAALKLAAYVDHAPRQFTLSQVEIQRREEEKGIFLPIDIMDYLPTAVLHEFKNKAGGGKSNIHLALQDLAQMDWPQVVMEVEGGRFELATRQLVKYLHGRLLTQIVTDHHGEVAARVCNLLEVKGYLESEAIAKSAMVPAQNVREVIHELYVCNYVSLLTINPNSKQVSNPNTSIYLWTVDKVRMAQTVNTNVCKAYLNLRLRRQHELEVGKDWIERAKEQASNAGTDENEHEEDKVNYQRFCEGLLRLDTMLLQLDETMMVLRDF